jgi:hypothetical protein
MTYQIRVDLPNESCGLGKTSLWFSAMVSERERANILNSKEAVRTLNLYVLSRVRTIQFVAAVSFCCVIINLRRFSF